MSKYQKGVFYIGNLVKYENGIEMPYRTNLYLIYDEKNDKFISFQDALNPSLDLLNPNLTPEERKKTEEEIDNFRYSYIPIKEEGKIYIDQSSIKVIIETEKRKKRP